MAKLLFIDNSPIMLYHTLRSWLQICVLTTKEPLTLNRIYLSNNDISVHFTFRKTKHLIIMALDDKLPIMMVKGGSEGKKFEVEASAICKGDF